jgi:hypothetical protein
MLCGHGPRRRRAQVGQIAIVEKHRLDQTGARGKQDHQPVEARQAQFGVVEEPRADLDRETAHPRHIGRLHIDLAMRLGQVHRHHRRHHNAAIRQRAEGLLDHPDRLEVEIHRAAQLGLGHDPDVMRHKFAP